MGGRTGDVEWTWTSLSFECANNGEDTSKFPFVGRYWIGGGIKTSPLGGVAGDGEGCCAFSFNASACGGGTKIGLGCNVGIGKTSALGICDIGGGGTRTLVFGFCVVCGEGNLGSSLGWMTGVGGLSWIAGTDCGEGTISSTLA